VRYSPTHAGCEAIISGTHGKVPARVPVCGNDCFESVTDIESKLPQMLWQQSLPAIALSLAQISDAFFRPTAFLPFFGSVAAVLFLL